MELLINGTKYNVEADPADTLLTVLREHLDLTGTKYGCGEGACGACTVLINGSAVKSCSLRVSNAVGKNITTIEGLAKGGDLHPVQHAFLEEDVFQCAYCAPGMIMATVAMLTKNGSPEEDEIKAALQGNMCRCGTYPRVIKAVHRAAKIQKG